MAKSQTSTLLPADEVVAQLVPLLTGRGATVHSVTPSTITGAVITRKKPSMIVFLILLIVMILPGILYMIFARRDISEPFAITITEGPAGTILTASGQGQGERVAQYAIGKVA